MEHVWVGVVESLKNFLKQIFQSLPKQFQISYFTFWVDSTFANIWIELLLQHPVFGSLYFSQYKYCPCCPCGPPVQCIRCHPLPTNGNCRILKRSDWKGSRLNITMMSIMNDDWYINSIFLNPWQDLDCCDDGILIPADVGVGGHEDGQGNLGIGIIISSFNHWEPSHLLGPFISRSLCK